MNGARDTPPTVANWADELKLAHLALADAEQGWHQLRAELQERLQDSLAQRQAALQAQQDSEARVQAVQKHLREQAGQLRALEQRLAEMEQELSLEHAQQQAAVQADHLRPAVAAASHAEASERIQHLTAQLQMALAGQRAALDGIQRAEKQGHELAALAEGARAAELPSVRQKTTKLQSAQAQALGKLAQALARERAERLAQGERQAQAAQAAAEDRARLQDKFDELQSREQDQRTTLEQTRQAHELTQARLSERQSEIVALNQELLDVTERMAQLGEARARDQALLQDSLSRSESRLEELRQQQALSEASISALRAQLAAAEKAHGQQQLAAQAQPSPQRESNDQRRWQTALAEAESRHEQQRTASLQRVIELEAELALRHERQVRERDQAAAALGAARAEMERAHEAFRALAANRSLALQALDELRERQRRQWLHEQAAATQEATARLRQQLEESERSRQALLMELNQARQHAAEAAPGSSTPAGLQSEVEAPTGRSQARHAETPDAAPKESTPPTRAGGNSQYDLAYESMLTMQTSTIHSVQDLLALFDEPFVQACYRTILGREPDGPGLTSHLNLLRHGVAKEQLIIEMVSCEEARLAPQPLEGVADLNLPLSGTALGRRGRMLRRLAAEAGLPEQHDLATVENRFGAALQNLRQETGQRLSALTQSLDKLSSSMNHGLARILESHAEMDANMIRQDEAIRRCEAACLQGASNIRALDARLAALATHLDGLLAAVSAPQPLRQPPGGRSAAALAAPTGLPLASVASVRQLLAVEAGLE